LEDLDRAAASEGRAAAPALLELWMRGDPARDVQAALALAAAHERAGEAGGDADNARAALQVAVDAAPGSALFWGAAAADARAGREDEAAALLGRGADAWRDSALEPALRACAAAHLGRRDPAQALLMLGAEGLARALGSEAHARLAERAGDFHALGGALAEAAAQAPTAERRAQIVARRAMTPGADGGAGRRALVEEALALMPDQPLALPLVLLEPTVDLDRAAEALGGSAAAGIERPDGARALAELFRFTAIAAAACSAGGADAGVDRAQVLVAAAAESGASDETTRAARLAAVRAAARLDPGRRARVLAALGAATMANPASGAPPAPFGATLKLQIAEALRATGSAAAAEGMVAGASGPLAADVGRLLARWNVSNAPHLPPGLWAGPADEVAAAARAAIAALVDGAATGRWGEVVGDLERSPPHEAAAGVATLHAAALVAEGRLDGREAIRLDTAAMNAAGGAAAAIPMPALGRVADDADDLATRAGALGLAGAALASSAGGEPDPRAASLVDVTLAHAYESAGEPAGAIQSWYAARERDPSSLPAALALRREAAGRGDVRAAIDAAEAEAGCLVLPAHRVRALRLAAALATEGEPALTDSGRLADTLPGRNADRPRALRLLRAALEIDPGHESAFESLRALLDEEGDAVGQATALGARIAVAANPFEVTSLRLARAEVLAEKLGDRAGARAELDAILQKQPDHPRALARFSELLWSDQSWSEAGEIYSRRATVEREPRALREIFLRLGYIYGERIPDAKRAAAAYERVRALDPDNRDALRALSQIYLGEGDAKLALPVTERLVAVETDPKRRTEVRIRFGELLMRAGELRRAGAELRRAVDAAPRDVNAVAALAQLLERARDVAGRRALLDHTAGLLRHDVDRGELDVETLRALARVLVLRDRPRAAAAAAQLVAALSGDAAALAELTGASPNGRSLSALRRAEIDERAFPPALPPGVRQLMRLAGPSLRPTGQELAAQLARHGVTRADRVGRGQIPRPLFDAVAAELGAGDFDLYVKIPAAKAAPVPVRVEPGAPASIIVGAPILALGGAAQRFAAGRTLRLVATHLDTLAALPPEEGAALLAGIIRQFVADYRPPGVRDALVELETGRAARLIPRKLKQDLMPFAVESAGPFDAAALHAAVRDGANAAGLLACANLPAALAVVLASSGLAAPTLALSPILAHPEALALLRFAVSDDYDELSAALETG
jgi:tetratricopeptide (TPR) repeat protein